MDFTLTHDVVKSWQLGNRGKLLRCWEARIAVNQKVVAKWDLKKRGIYSQYHHHIYFQNYRIGTTIYSFFYLFILNEYAIMYTLLFYCILWSK